jgi:hypothetical protein
MAASYYRAVTGYSICALDDFSNICSVFVCYDITNRDSFNHVKDWWEELQRYAPEESNKILIGMFL